MEQFRSKEAAVASPISVTVTNRRILHPVFVEGTIIGILRERQGIIVQFDSMATPSPPVLLAILLTCK